MPPRASIVIPVWNEVEVTLRCLEALSDNTPDDLYEVVIVDNASTDATPDLLAGLEGDVVVITNEENVGYTLASNQGAAASSGEVVVFLNNDTEPQPGWLEALLGVLDAHPECAVVGSKLVYPDGRLQEAGACIFGDGSGWNVGRHDDPDLWRVNEPCEVDYCSGASIAVRRELLDAMGGGYDPRYAPAYYEDADLGFEARARGWTVRYEPTSVVVHHEGVTAGTDLASGMKAHQVRNQRTFRTKWADVLAEYEPPPTATGRAPTTSDRLRRPVQLARRATSPPRPGPQRVLVVEPLLPLHDVAAGGQRMFRILELLRAAGHDVTYLARDGQGQDRYRHELAGMGIRVHATDRVRLAEQGTEVADDVPSLDVPRILRRGRFDVVWLSFLECAWQYLPIVRHHAPQARVWIDTVDVHSLRERRQAELAAASGDPRAPLLAVQARRTEARERWLYSLADGLVAVTPEDAAELERLVPGAVTAVVPTIHPLADEPARLAGRSGALFVGNFMHPPNVDAVRWLLELWPAVRARVPDATCTVVGRALPPDLAAALAAAPGLEHAGWVADLASVQDRIRVSVAPLRFGAGIKGKVCEALAAGIPVVTTTVGAEGIGIVDGVHAAVADDAAGQVERIARLLADDDEWHRLAGAGRDLVAERLTPEAVAGALEELLLRDTTAVAPRPREVGPGGGDGPLRPEGVVVFGMHRSGTSMLAGLLADLGLDPGPREALLGASPANPRGHLELESLMAIDNQVLQQLGRYWHCPPDPDVFTSSAFDPVRSRIAEVLRTSLPPTGWLYKDPRVCVVWPLHAPLFPVPPVGVLIVRHPADVVTSLHTRDGMDRGHALALWDLHNRWAARFLATFDHAVVVTYDEVLGDPVGTATRLRDALRAGGIDLAADGDAVGVVDGSLDRSSRRRDEVELDAGALQLWDDLRAVAAGERDLAAIAGPGEATRAAMAERARRIAAHVDALVNGWEEPKHPVHRPPA